MHLSINTYRISLSFRDNFSGETAANKAKIIQGQSNVELSDHGRYQAQQLGQHLKTLGVKFDFVYSSDLSRAYETCQLIVGQDNDIVIDDRLRERAFGDIEGKSLETFRSEAAKAGYDSRTYSSFTPPGAETLAQVNDRVRDYCLHHLVNVVEPGCNVLVVTHGGVIREFVRFFRDRLRCDLADMGMEPLRVTPNTGLSQFRICYRAKQLLIADCIKIHEVCHLESDENLSEMMIEVKKEKPISETFVSDSVPLEAL